MNLKIFTMTHKKFEVPTDSMYVPLQVGSAVHPDLGYLRDDVGENISAQNGYYSELTGLYWIWKNVADVDYVGTCHYRRFLINEQEKVLTKWEYQKLFMDYDLVTTRKVRLTNSYHYGFSANHNIHALDMTGEVIREKYPAYYETFLELVNGPQTYFGNIFVTSKTLYDAYCEFLFTVFFEVQKRIDMDTDADDYHRRVFGFISEFLLYVWTTVRKLKVFECKVGMIGEKAETREMKSRLSQFLKKKDIVGAKAYFLEEHKKRPDILMEASDITGELHLAMQMIATADEEIRRTGRSFLDVENDFTRLVPVFSKLNHCVAAVMAQQQSEMQKHPYKEDSEKLFEATVRTVQEKMLADGGNPAVVSQTAVVIAVTIFPKKER